MLGVNSTVPRGTATILVGVAIGIVGVIVYTQWRTAVAEEDAEQIIDRLSDRLHELESGSPKSPSDVPVV